MLIFKTLHILSMFANGHDPDRFRIPLCALSLPMSAPEPHTPRLRRRCRTRAPR